MVYGFIVDVSDVFAFKRNRGEIFFLNKTQSIFIKVREQLINILPVNFFVVSQFYQFIMEIEFDRLAKCYFLKLEKLLEFWGRDPESFLTLQAGEELFYKQLVLCCGVTEQTVFNIVTYSLVCETNQVSTRPQPVEVISTLNFHGLDRDISIEDVKCSICEGKCKHVAAVLIYLNRNDISCLPEYVGKDMSKIREKIMANFYDDSDEDDEEEVGPMFTIFDGRKYDNSDGVPPRERFHIRFCEAVDKNQAERKAKEKAGGKAEEDDADDTSDSDD